MFEEVESEVEVNVRVVLMVSHHHTRDVHVLHRNKQLSKQLETENFGQSKFKFRTSVSPKFEWLYNSALMLMVGTVPKIS